MKALGMIEVYGYLAAVEALDSALKAANVNLLSVTKVKGGLVTVLVTGDVGAVKAAMDASSSAAERVGTVVSVHVIPRPADDVARMLSGSTESPAPEPPSPVTGPETSGPEKPEEEEPEEPKQEEPAPSTVHLDSGVDPWKVSAEEMAKMTVPKIRRIARTLKLTNMTGKQIKFAKKEALIDAICEFRDRRDD